MNPEAIGPSAVLKLPKQPGGMILAAQRVSTGVSSSPKLTSLPVTVVFLNGLIAALVTSQSGMPGGPKQTAQRNADRAALIKALVQLRDYVTSVARQQPTTQDAIQVIVDAGMFAKGFTRPSKAELEARYGGVTTNVHLIAAAVPRASAYYWTWSTDMKNWVSLPETTGAKTTATGLTVGTTYYFRVRALVTKTGLTDWSQAVSFMVR
jgi:hypothetical protein